MQVEDEEEAITSGEDAGLTESNTTHNLGLGLSHDGPTRPPCFQSSTAQLTICIATADVCSLVSSSRMPPSFFSKLVKTNAAAPERTKGHSKASSQDLTHSSTSSSILSSPSTRSTAPKIQLTTDSHPLSPVSISPESIPRNSSFAASDRSDPPSKAISASNSPRPRNLPELEKSEEPMALGVQSTPAGRHSRHGSIVVQGSGRSARGIPVDEHGVLQQSDSNEHSEAQEVMVTTDKPLVESPTSSGPTVNILIQNAYVDARSQRAPGAGVGQSSAMLTTTSDPESMSLGSGSSHHATTSAFVPESPSRVNGGDGSGKKKGWRRASLRSRKGSAGAGNLASALAASGLAMANHGMRMSPPPMPPMPGNAGSGLTSHGTRVDNSSYTRTSPQGSPPMNATYHPNIHASRSGGVHNLDGDDNDEFYSNSEASDDSPDELDDEISGMPVTGFAVASYKRNADFHELFPGVPEGDYLIEGVSFPSLSLPTCAHSDAR